MSSLCVSHHDHHPYTRGNVEGPTYFRVFLARTGTPQFYVTFNLPQSSQIGFILYCFWPSSLISAEELF